MKKLLPLALALAMVPSLSFAARPIEVYVAGRDLTEQSNPNPPIVRDNRTFLPLRAVIENMGMTVDWNEKDRVVTVKDGDMAVSMTIGKQVYRQGNKEEKMDVAPFISNNRTYVPLRFMAKGLGMDVDWDEENRIAIIGSYLKEKIFDEKDRVKSDGYHYILPKEAKDRLVIKKEKGQEVFYDKANMTKEGYGRIGEIRVEKDPVTIPVPMILLDKVKEGYLVFTFSSDVEVTDVENDALVKSYRDAKEITEKILKTITVGQ